MLSALKRLAGNKENNAPAAPPGHQTMSHTLQRKFARGVQYNMKIIIKGDRNTGKTCLFHRLQGMKFVQEYLPTEEIQVASIQWSYKTTDDVVKVEVWDVVDKGRKRPPLDGLKLGTDQGMDQPPALDAQFLDVYKGTHGVILVMDITKNWTFDYVQKEIAKVPEHIPILVLGNHCDMSHHRTVTKDVITYFIDSVQRGPGKGQIRYTESSMSNGFGLKYLHKYLCIPYLQLQKETLMGQLERNSRETEITLHELDLFQQDSDYETFLTGLSQKRREAAEVVSSAQSSVGPLSVGRGVPIRPQQPAPASRAAPLPQVQPQPPVNLASDILLNKANPGLVGVLDSSVASVDEFVPDGGSLDKGFLEDPTPSNDPAPTLPDSDSEASDGGNPLVSGYQDDLDPDDSLTAAPPLPVFEASFEAPQFPTGQSIKEDELSNWLGHLEDRGSPEGGEDDQENTDNNNQISGPMDNNNPCTIIRNNNASQLKGKGKDKTKHKQKHKKKSSKERDEDDKEDKKKKKKSIKNLSNDHNSLEDFLNSPDPTYEAI